MEDPQPSLQSLLDNVRTQLRSTTDPSERIELRLEEASLRIDIIDEDISSCNDANEKQLLLQRLVALENKQVALENQKAELHKKENVLIAGMPFPLTLVNHHSFTQLGDANDGNNANDNNEDAQSTTSMSDPLGTPQRVEVTNLPSNGQSDPLDVKLKNSSLNVKVKNPSLSVNNDNGNALKVEIQNPSLVVRSDDANPLKIQDRRTCGVFPDNPVQVGVLATSQVTLLVTVVVVILMIVMVANHS